MIRLLALLLCLVSLWGCAKVEPPLSVPSVTQPSPVLLEAEASLAQRYSMDVHVLSQKDVRRMWDLPGGYLLLSGQRLLTVLDEGFTQTASLTLGFDLEHDALHVGETISLFDAPQQALLILDAALQEIHRIQLPSDQIGTPIASARGTSVYYATAHGIYHWDLESGIRRRIQEGFYNSPSLTDLHKEDTILQIQDTGSPTRFLSTQTGQLLQQTQEEFTLTTQGNHFYATVPIGAMSLPVFGIFDGIPQVLLPEDLFSQPIYLPKLEAAVTLSQQENRWQMQYYHLPSGALWGELELEEKHCPLSILSGSNDVKILIYDPEYDYCAIMTWVVVPEPNTGKYTDAWYPDDVPNQAGLAACQRYAQDISQTYGIKVKIWEEAVQVQPWDYRFQPEHLYQVLLRGLEQLDACLARYPKNILPDTANHFGSLNFCLVRSIAGNSPSQSLNTPTGIQFLDSDDAYVVIALGPYMEQAIYHELFHVMETHIWGNSTALDHWNLLNPGGFSYDCDFAANLHRNSGVYLEGSHRAFVDTYSMSFPKEDRARIFEYAMLPNQDHLFQAPAMAAKLTAICQGLREAYHLAEEDLPWEMYLP